VTRLVALVACVVVALAFAFAVPAADAAAKPATAKRVCFKKTVRTKSGRKVRKKVCRAPKNGAAATKKTPAVTLPAPIVAPAPITAAAPVPAAAPAAPPTGPAPTAPARACQPEASNRLLATARDLSGRFVLSLSRLCLLSGRTIVQLNNTDAQNHDLWAEGTSPAVPKREVVDTAAPGATEEANVDLTAGNWRLFCSIEGHENMSRTVTVVD
jgi:hypothetical protein